MPVFLWRFEYRRRRRNSNKESHWLSVSAYKLLEYSQVICIWKMSTIFTSTLTSYYIQLYLLKRCIKPPPLMLSCKCMNFLKRQKQPAEVFHKKGTIFTKNTCIKKYLCGLFGVNFIKKNLQNRYFPVNIMKFLTLIKLRQFINRLWTIKLSSVQCYIKSSIKAYQNVTINFYIFELVWFSNFSFNKQFWFFLTNLP